MLANSIVFSRIGILAFRHAVAAKKRSRSADAARRIVFTSWCLCAFVRQSSHNTLLENLEKVDQIEKTEIKQLDTYIDQVTTDKLSLVSRLRTSDDIVQNCSDKDLLRT
jgi:hypothetical protein